MAVINLLPPENKRQIKAGRSNVLLIRYCIFSLMLAILLSLLIGGVYILMNDSRRTAEATIDNSKRKSSEYSKVQSDVAEFNQNLAIAKSILDKEVHYSKIAVKVAQILPSGIVLDSLQLDSKTFGQPTTLNASAKSYNDSLRLKSALENSKYFDNVHLQSVSMAEGDYPVSISISTVINREIMRL